MMAHGEIFLVLLSLAAGCQFPFENNSSWTVMHPTRKTTYTFTDSTFTKSICNGNECSMFKYKCRESDRNGVYYAEISPLKQGRRATKYSCVAFLQHSEYVFQLRESDSMLYEYPNVCDKKHLNLKNEIAISDSMPETFTTECPFTGGRFMSVFDSRSNPTCRVAVIPPRLEGGCMGKSSFVFDFLRQECMDDRLGMTNRQTTSCVQSWTFRNFKYYLLKDHGDPKTHWCLRVNATVSQNGPDNALLYMAQECPVGLRNRNFLKLELTPVVGLTSPCSDPYSICDDERVCMDDTMMQFCPRKCNLCGPVQPSCTFPLALRARWHDGDSKTVLNISETSVSFSGGAAYTCYRQEGLKFVVTLSQDGGCFPQFVCLDFRKLYLSSLEYFTNESPRFLPVNFTNIVNDVCDEQITDENEPIINIASTYEDATNVEYNSNDIDKPYAILLNTDMPSSFIACWMDDWLPESFHRKFEETGSESSEVCSTCFTYERELKPAGFSDVTYDCGPAINGSTDVSNDKSKEELNQCVGLFYESDERVILTKTQSKSDEYLFWVFSNYDSYINMTVHVYDFASYKKILKGVPRSEIVAKRVMEVGNTKIYPPCPDTEYIFSSSTSVFPKLSLYVICDLLLLLYVSLILL